MVVMMIMNMGVVLVALAMMLMLLEMSVRTIVTNSMDSDAEGAATECHIYSYGMLTMSIYGDSDVDVQYG